MESCLYEGTVWHRRASDVDHAFTFPLFMVYLDLAELDEVFARRWLWSTARPAPAWFRRQDHLGDASLPLDEAVRALVEEETGSRPTGAIRLLTNLRYWGYALNPISVYYCFSADGGRLEHLVADVTNTPWGERHSYVLSQQAAGGSRPRAHSPKALHVSPFMGMDHDYHWRIGTPEGALRLEIESHQHGEGPVFRAGLFLERREMSTAALASMLFRFPAMTLQVLGGIYWQAFRLHRKGARFHPHPRSRSGTQLEIAS